MSWQPVEQLAVGIAPHVGYSDVSLRLFPKTSSSGPDGAPGTADDFAGLDMSDECARNFGLGTPGGTCPWDVVFGVKIGAVYRVTPTVTVGASYTSPIDFNHRDGRLKLNFSNAGLGRVSYESEVEGIKWPQSVEGWPGGRPGGSCSRSTWPGTTGRPPRAWSSRPRTRAWSGPPAGSRSRSRRSGDRNLTPAVCVVLEHHLSAGLGYRPTRHLRLDLGVLYALENTVTYTNTGTPFGPGAVNSPSGLQVDVALGYRF